MKITLIVPTLREAKNLAILVPEVFKTLKKSIRDSFELIIVDDNSRDGTEELIRKLSRKYPVRLIVRTDEKGLSSAVIRGFEAAKGDHIIVMDADLSHPVSLLPLIVDKLAEGYDVVLPSRYMEGGGAEKWPLLRKMISLVATSMARPLTDTKDPMSGYFGIKRSVIRGVSLNPIGYKILLEILVKGRYDRKRTISLPYMFKNRNIGASKLNGKIYFEYVEQLFSLYIHRLSGLFRKKN
jgi:dolichol-phosphate mannosyltransferase